MQLGFSLTPSLSLSAHANGVVRCEGSAAVHPADEHQTEQAKAAFCAPGIVAGEEQSEISGFPRVLRTTRRFDRCFFEVFVEKTRFDAVFSDPLRNRSVSVQNPSEDGLCAACKDGVSAHAVPQVSPL